MMDYDENEDEKEKKYGDDENEQEDGVNLVRNYNDSEDPDDDENGEEDDEDEDNEADEGSSDNGNGKNKNNGQKGKKDKGKEDGGEQKGKELDGDKIKDDLGKESEKLDNPKSEGGKGDTPKADTSSQSPTNAPEGGSMPNASGGAPATGTGTPAGAAPSTTGAGAATGTTAGATSTVGASAGATTSAAGTTAAASASGAAASGAAAAGIGAAAIPIAIIALIILLIIIIVGVIAFFIYMPGQVTAKLKNLGVKFLDSVQAMAQGEENVVKRSEIAEVANYLEKMGYDLRGEGFVTGDVLSPEGQTEISEIFNNEEIDDDHSHYDAQQMVLRDNETDDITAIYSNPIKTYIVSDNLCYIVKNNNANLSSMVGNHPVYAFVGTIALVAAFFVSPVLALSAVFTFVAIGGGNPTWGSGLISIYHEKDGQIGQKGDFYKDIERGFIELDPETKQLKVKRGWTNNAYTFDVDGWSGRYGMPLEFLLSIHVATQMPDLAMEIATSFDTDVQVLLHPVDSGKVQAGYNVGPGDSSDNDFVTWDDVMNVVQNKQTIATELWNKLVNWAGNHTSFIDSDEYQLFTIQSSEYVKLFKMGLPHAEGGCTCCEHIPGANPGELCDSTGEIDPDSDDFDFDGHTICENCKEQIAWVIAALQKIEDKNWNSYTPYISEVRDHWFRDVFFVIDDINSTDVVLNDEFYFYLTNERWSVYETYKEGESMPEGFVAGDYKLYNYDSATDTYTLSTKSKAEVDEINEKIANGDTSVSRLVKKAKTEKISNIVDAEGNQALSGIDGNKWLAYTTEDTSINWTKMEMTEDTEEILQKFDGKLYYKESRPDDIKQIEDGQRTATNPKIKKMFVDNTYYQYDGSITKAQKIEEDRAKYDPATFNTSNDPRLRNEESKSLLGKVSISKDSLNAFSMLENMHTLDADYVYNDFKELIVELNYFDKEELSSKIDKVMTWLLPETGASGWPVRKYDKGETFYGTLIHSKADLELLRKADEIRNKKIALQMQEDEELRRAEDEIEDFESENPIEGMDVENTTTSALSSSLSLSNSNLRTDALLAGLTGGPVDIQPSDKNGAKYQITINGVTYTRYFQAGQSYSSNTFTWSGASKTIGRAGCGPTSMVNILSGYGYDLNPEKDITGLNFTATCDGLCTLYSQWTGGGTSQAFYSDYEQHITEAFEEGKPVIVLCKNSPDSFWTSGGHFVACLGVDDSGNLITADPAGASKYERMVYPKGISGLVPYLKGMWVPDEIPDGANTASAFEGYEPEEPVVAPITGKVVDQGTVQRENVETGEMEEVGYIKIQAIDKYTFNNGQGYTNCKKEEDTFEDKASEDAKKLEGYDYFFDEYQGVLEGFVLYMEGFDITLDETKALVDGGDTESPEVTQYKANPVYNMVDDLEEARSYWKEDAKAAALPIVEINGELYVKEGTVIGKTCDDAFALEEDETGEEAEEEVTLDTEEPKPNGNYIRLIFRNLEDAIEEDVESYFNITDSYSFSGSAINVQNIDSMNQELASLIEQLAGPLESEYPGIVNILKAISMNESGGGTNPAAGDDPMQAVESTGGNAGDSIGGMENSVKAAINALKSAWDKAKSYGINDLRVVIQAYNFGSGFVDYTNNKGKHGYDKSLVESFSDEQAARHGWDRYGDKNYVDPKIYKYLPDLNV